MKHFLLDENSERIFLGDCVTNESRLMSPVEIFSHFVRGKGPFTSYQIDEQIANISFKKRSLDVRYRIQLASKTSHIVPSIAEKELTLEEALIFIKLGYIIIEKAWFPLSLESLEEIKKIVHKTESFSLDTHVALRMLTNSDGKFLNREAKNIVEVFEEQGEFLDQKNSSLFVRDLYDYQQRGVAWLKFCVANKIGTILGDDMGLGKTAQIIALICWLIENKVSKKILIVVPSTLLENWRREFTFFAPELVPCIHHGYLRIGVSRDFEEYHVVITSYSLVINDFYLLDDIAWDLTILDEASLIKNPESERTKKIKSLNSHVRIVMTGTPVENSLVDLWSLVDYCYPNFFPPLDEFKNKYIGKNVEETLQNDLFGLKSLTKMIMLRRMKIDILDGLPDKIDIHQALTMSDYERREYSRLRQEILDSVSSNQEACFKLINELRQFTTHPFLCDPIKDKRSRFLNATKLSTKFARTLEILDEVKEKGEKVLIFTGYIEMIDLFKEYLSERYKIDVFGIDGRVETLERQVQIDHFSTKVGFSVMVLNPTTAAMGLNITAANHVIHYTRQWNPAIEMQASARAYRNGQNLGVNIYYLFYVDTIEQIMDQRLKDKESLSGEVITVVEHHEDEMKEILDSLIDEND